MVADLPDLRHGWSLPPHDSARSRPERPFHPHDRVEPLTPDQVYELAVEIWPTCIVLPAGYSLALTIQGHDLTRDRGGSELETFANVMRGSGAPSCTTIRPTGRPTCSAAPSGFTRAATPRRPSC